MREEGKGRGKEGTKERDIRLNKKDEDERGGRGRGRKGKLNISQYSPPCQHTTHFTNLLSFQGCHTPTHLSFLPAFSNVFLHLPEVFFPLYPSSDALLPIRREFKY